MTGTATRATVAGAAGVGAESRHASEPYSTRSSCIRCARAMAPIRGRTRWWRSSWWRWRASIHAWFASGSRTNAARTRRRICFDPNIHYNIHINTLINNNNNNNITTCTSTSLATPWEAICSSLRDLTILPVLPMVISCLTIVFEPVKFSSPNV